MSKMYRMIEKSVGSRVSRWYGFVFSWRGRTWLPRLMLQQPVMKITRWMLRKTSPKVGGAWLNNWAVVDDKNGTIEQFNTPVGRTTYNIVQIKSKREKNQLQAWTIKACRMSATTSLYNLNTDRMSSLAWESVRKHQKILHNNGLADNIICL